MFFLSLHVTATAKCLFPHGLIMILLNHKISLMSCARGLAEKSTISNDFSGVAGLVFFSTFVVNTPCSPQRQACYMVFWTWGKRGRRGVLGDIVFYTEAHMVLQT